MTSKPDGALPLVAVVSPLSTLGLRTSDRQVAELLEAAGCVTVFLGLERPGASRGVSRIPGLADLVQSARIARLVHHANSRRHIDAVVFTTVGGTFFVPARVLRRSALRFDALSCENRRTPSGLLARLLERRAMRHLPMLLPLSTRRDPSLPRERFLRQVPYVVPVPPPLVDWPAAREPRRPEVFLTYGGSPFKKGLDIVVRAWQQAAVADDRLRVIGIDEDRARSFLADAGALIDDRVEFLGEVSQGEFARQLRQAQIYLAASRYEDYGAAQLEAMYCGAVVVTVRSAGPFEAGALLAEIDPSLVAAEPTAASLARAIRHARNPETFDAQAYRDACAPLLERYSYQRVLASVREQVVPILVGSKTAPDGGRS